MPERAADQEGLLPALRFALLAHGAAHREMDRAMKRLKNLGHHQRMAARSEAFLDAQDAKESTGRLLLMPGAYKTLLAYEELQKNCPA